MMVHASRNSVSVGLIPYVEPANFDLIHFCGKPTAESDPSLQSRWLHRPNRQ